MIVDNLQWYDYRVEYASERLYNFDKVIWFGCNDYQVELLKEKKCKHKGIEIINIEHQIRNGKDFDLGQDKCFQFVKNNYDYDVFVMQSADELLTDYGIQEVESWINNSDENFAAFMGQSNKLYCETLLAPIVFQIMRRGVNYRSNKGGDNKRFCDDIDIVKNLKYSGKNYLVDIGYISTEVFYKKMINWNRLCYGSPEKEHLIKLYEEGDLEEFIFHVFKYFRSEFHGATDKKIVMENEGEYKRLIEDFNLQDDFNLVKKVLDERSDNN